MSIRPIDFNGMIQRTDNVSQVKIHEDQKPMMDQQSIQVQVAQHEDAMRHQVIDPRKGSQMDNHADAREEGKNKYFSNQKKKKKAVDGKVVKKGFERGFDIKI